MSSKQTQYKGVRSFISNGHPRFTARFGGHQKSFDTIRQAAIHYDICRIKSGKTPINILTKKN